MPARLHCNKKTGGRFNLLKKLLNVIKRGNCTTTIYVQVTVSRKSSREYFFFYQGTGILDQIVGTALLLFCLRAITDEQNMKVPQHLIPMVSNKS